MPNSGRSQVRRDTFYSQSEMRRYNQKPKIPPITNFDQFLKNTTPIVTARHLPKFHCEKVVQVSAINEVAKHESINEGKFWPLICKHYDANDAFPEKQFELPIPNAFSLLLYQNAINRYLVQNSNKQSQHLNDIGQQTSVNERSHDECNLPYFVLDDLWESFREWSAYGAGVPLVLNEIGSVVHYYAPYLSAIQLYVDPSTPVASIMRPDEQSISDSSRSPSSDSSSYEGGAVGHDPCAQENNTDSISPGLLAFEYIENSSLFQRAPFSQKAKGLASEFPELKTYRSCDLTPSSWFSVAWCPIYAIPFGQSIEDVDSCFLTFHSLSTPLSSTHSGTSCVCGPTISLPSFGLTASNFRSSDWTQDAVHGMEKVNSLIQSTDNWLRRLRVNHPDYVFFKNHNSCSDSASFVVY